MSNRVLINGNYFEANRARIREWMMARNLYDVWVRIARHQFVNYAIDFFDEDDSLAFILTFETYVEDPNEEVAYYNDIVERIITANKLKV